LAERLKAAVLKTADGKPSESSNLSSSATFYRPAQCAGLFCFLFSRPFKILPAFQRTARF
ncbi:hypothetical protein, partial [Pantoea ananatis]|uniref:hypothetical protein n=1 Tax=Pantoea ananas TaxID=553 RepID=UPI001B3098EC